MFLRYFLIIAMIFLTGCATSSPGREASPVQPSKALDVSTSLKFQDVPVPAGFKCVTNNSFVFENDAVRVGILKYSGRPNAGDVITFYKNQMPLYGWEFINAIEYGQHILNFEKEGQTCAVVIEAAKLSTIVTITVSPKPGKTSSYKPFKK